MAKDLLKGQNEEMDWKKLIGNEVTLPKTDTKTQPKTRTSTVTDTGTYTLPLALPSDVFVRKVYYLFDDQVEFINTAAEKYKKKESEILRYIIEVFIKEKGTL